MHLFSFIYKVSIARIKIEKLFNQQQQILSRQALRGMISLLQGSIFDSNRSAASKPLNQPKLKRLSIVSEDKKHFLSNSILSRVILPWLCDLSRCTSDTIPESIPSEALDKFMQNNLDLWPELIHFCYSPNLLIAKRFFLALSRLWCSRSVAYSLPVILNLIIYKVFLHFTYIFISSSVIRVWRLEIWHLKCFRLCLNATLEKFQVKSFL